jgi:hypothetical protein
MRTVRVVALFVALTTVFVRADVISGTWRMTFDVPPKQQPACCDSLSLNVLVSGASVTGSIVMGDWPGHAPITEGTFTDGHLSVKAKSDETSSTGHAQVEFDGTLTGDLLKGTLSLRYPEVDKEKVVAKWTVSGKKTA